MEKKKMHVSVNWESAVNKVCYCMAVVAGTVTGCAISNVAWKPKTVSSMVIDLIATSIVSGVCISGYALILDKAWGTNCLKYKGSILEVEVEDIDAKVFTY